MNKRSMILVTAASVLTFAGTAGAGALRVIKLDRGDQAFINGTSLACAVTQAVGTSKQVSCFKVDKAGHPRPASYGVAIADNGVAVVRFRAGGKSTIIFQRKH